MNNLHAINAKYIGPTNSRGSRVKLTSDRFEQSVTIPYDHSLRGTCDIAAAWLTAQGFNLVAQAEQKDSYILLSDTFKPLKGE